MWRSLDYNFSRFDIVQLVQQKSGPKFAPKTDHFRLFLVNYIYFETTGSIVVVNLHHSEFPI